MLFSWPTYTSLFMRSRGMRLYTEEEEAVSRLNTIPAIRGSSLCVVADSELLLYVS